ncbi:MAG: polyribonucleotide nucleotidyltransferase [Thermodesulfobacteriota bacterium]
MYKKVSTTINGHEFSIETGKLAKQASGAAWVTHGETVVLVTAVADYSVREGIDFIPLTVDYQEFGYAAGRIPGNFFRREMGRPSERETLTSRLIDRPVRPNIPKGWGYETQVIANVYSVDKVNDPDVMALTGASCALCLSEIPFNGPIAGVRVGRVGGEFILNPTDEQREKSDLDLIVAGSRDAVVMVEGGAELVSEDVVLEAIWFAHAGLQPLIDMQLELMAACGKAKRAFTPPAKDEELIAQVRELSAAGMKEILSTRPKLERYEKVRLLKAEVIEALGEAAAGKANYVKDLIDHLEAEAMREMILHTGQRVDGRDLTTVRPISCEVGVLPRTHGSALFTRGETQALVTCTLGTSGDEQRIETVIKGDIFRRFMLHYNFPPFSVNEVKRLGGPGRREIGHGALARRAVGRVLPSKESFPYSIRAVSDIMESNGSSSMATVCGSSLAMMDAGVPLKAPVAGVAMGLIMEGERIAVLTDILGDEDHLGDMDFKVAGTSEGITAVQMDIKIAGISKQIMGRALAQARDGRLHILGEMAKALSRPRGDISNFAPRITTIKIPVEKIKDIIGPGGKIIRGMQMETGAKIDVEDDGTVHVAAVDGIAGAQAIKMIRDLTQEAEEGAVYEGKVVRIMDFGAFVEIMPGRDGLVHISELDHMRVRSVTDVIKEGDVIRVKVLGVDDRGKVRLSRKALLPPPTPEELAARQEAEQADGQGERREYRERRDDRRGDRGDRDRRPPRR